MVNKLVKMDCFEYSILETCGLILIKFILTRFRFTNVIHIKFLTNKNYNNNILIIQKGLEPLFYNSVKNVRIPAMYVAKLLTD